MTTLNIADGTPYLLIEVAHDGKGETRAVLSGGHLPHDVVPILLREVLDTLDAEPLEAHEVEHYDSVEQRDARVAEIIANGGHQ
jgi:hypothetical protein